MDRGSVLEILENVRHPGLRDRSIVELSMVDKVEVTDDLVRVTLAFSKRRDPLAEYLIGSTKATIIRSCPKGVKVEVDTVIKDENRGGKPATVSQHSSLSLDLEQINKVKHIVGIASAKGGVGKSTVAVNLAISLSRLGYKVGLVDADIYGPSIPTMTATLEQIPQSMGDSQGKDLICPLEKFGIKWMSVGYFAKSGQALIWRGAMACNALKQMILQVYWGELDFLLIDMPPGTGDIHISLLQDIPFDGAVMVTTPQALAVADVEKGIDMLLNQQIDKKIFGLIENMSWFTPLELPENKYYIFGKGGGAMLAAKFNIPLLAQLPIIQGIRESGDNGLPVALESGLAAADIFLDLARNFVVSVKKSTGNSAINLTEKSIKNSAANE